MRKVRILLLCLAMLCIMAIGASATEYTVIDGTELKGVTLTNDDNVIINYSKKALSINTDKEVDITIRATNASSTYKTGGNIEVSLIKPTNIKTLYAKGNITATMKVGNIGTVTAGGNVSIPAAGNISKINAIYDITLDTAVLTGTATAGGDVTINHVLGKNAIVNGHNVAYTPNSTSETGIINATGAVVINGPVALKKLTLLETEKGTPSASISGVVKNITGTGNVTIQDGGSVMTVDGDDLTFTVIGLEGTGTEEAPYKIDTLTKLEAIRYDLDAHYMLTADIDAKTSSDTYGTWKRIEDKTFTGTLDGQGYTIHNLLIPAYGLFDNMQGVTISNINFENVEVKGTSNIHSLFGFVALKNGQSSTIKNITVTNYRNRGDDHAAGIAGVRADGTDGILTLENISIRDAYIYGFDGSSLLAIGWENAMVDAKNCSFENVAMPVAEYAEEKWVDFDYDKANERNASLLFMHKGNSLYSDKQTLTADEATIESLLAALPVQTGSRTMYDARVKLSNKEILTDAEYTVLEQYVAAHPATEAPFNPDIAYILASLDITCGREPADSNIVQVTYESEGAREYVQFVENTVALGTLPTMERSGYTFLGWYHGDTVVTPETIFAVDTTVTAQWEEDTTPPTQGPDEQDPDKQDPDKQDPDKQDPDKQDPPKKDNPTLDIPDEDVPLADLPVPGLNRDDHFAYITGYNDGTFGAQLNITRAETAAIFSRLLAEAIDTTKTYATTFQDITAQDWFADEVGYLEQYGIISGYEDGTFRGNEPITRAEFATIASRFDDLVTNGTVKFSDVPSTHWASSYILSSAEKGWITGYSDGTFKPAQNITRAESVTLVNRVLERYCDQAYVATNLADLTTFTDLTTTHWAYYQVLEAANGHDYTKTDATETWTELH